MLHQKQKEICASDKKFKVVRAGRRGGKTYTIIEEIMFRAVKTKGSRIFYVAPTQKQARDIIWVDLKRRIHEKKIPANYNESRLEIEIGESIVYLAGWENKENFRGKSADLIVFDELDTMRNFMISYEEIFLPAILDRKGSVIFIGTPKKENPNLKRLEKIAKTNEDFECFHFTTKDNPIITEEEFQKIIKDLDEITIKQEFLAEYVENTGSLFSYSAILDVFSNTITKDKGKYLCVDVAGDGNDKTVFSCWEGLEEIWQENYQGLNGEMIINKIREYASLYQIPYSHIAIDAIGIGEFVASSSLLSGVIAYKSSYSAIKTEQSIISLPNVSSLKPILVSDFQNLRSQCIFKLAEYVNNHKIASKITGQFKENIIEELSIYQDVSRGDGKRMATQKDDVKVLIGRSPDNSDTWIMRMYFEIRAKVLNESPENVEVFNRQKNQMLQKRERNMTKTWG